MATNPTALKLHAPLQALVLASAKDAPDAFGHTEKDKAEVDAWMEKVLQGDIAKTENLKTLDTELTPRTYLVGNSFTAADTALYGALHPIFSQLQAPQYFSNPAVTRYFDHIQSLPSVRAAAETTAPAFSFVSFDLASAPKLERKPDPPKEKKKKDAAAPAGATAAPAKKGKTAAAVEPAAGGSAESGAPAPVSAPEGGAPAKAPKGEKKAKAPKAEGGAAAEGGKKKGGGGGGGKAAPAEDAGEPAPSMVDLRVGHIVDIHKHPDADGLYVEQIDFGEEEGPRTVVSGLVNYIPIEQMRDKYLVGVCNLKPANMRGVKSFAMVLCATSKDGKDAGIELVQPPADSKVGDRVYFEGSEYEGKEPLAQLNPKKKIFETIQPGFITLDSHEAAWVNPDTKSVHRIRTAKGVCVAPTFVGASLS